jgi:LmbE family N-acetylglucosaminyl deacetylase
MEASEKRELLAAPHPEDFGICWIGLVAKEDDGGSVFG